MWEALQNWLFGHRGPHPSDPVKLVHTDDLRKWAVFPRCQDAALTTYAEYREGARQLERLRKAVKPLLHARDRLAELDTDEPIVYRSTSVTVPRSPLRRPVSLPLPEQPLPGTWSTSRAGVVRNGRLETVGRWRRRVVLIDYVGPSRTVHAEEIAALRRRLADMSEDDRRVLEEIDRSRFAHPVLFVSHRWETVHHPDPSGRTLERLRTLRNCFLIYDYTSFPQEPRTEPEERRFQEILTCMDRLIDNVVILGAPDYLTRGWCVYEYIVSSLQGRVVCDEVADPAFVELRDWAATPPPVSVLSLFRDGFESAQANFISERILRSVNAVGPLFGRAEFRNRQDRALVTRLLLVHLKGRLPARKKSQTHLGEWATQRWTEEELSEAFVGHLEVPSLETQPIERFRTDVPTTLEEAVARAYRVQRYSVLDLLNPYDSVFRGLGGFGELRRTTS